MPTIAEAKPKLPAKPKPDTELIEVDDDEPVDSQYADLQQCLLAETIRHFWTAPEGKPFRFNIDVGIYFEDDTDHPLIPDAMLTLDLPPTDILKADHRSHFVWIIGKVPDVVIEIVSHKKRGEDSWKMAEYLRRGIPNYVVYDPENRLKGGLLRVFRRRGGEYRANAKKMIPATNLGLQLWKGKYCNFDGTWLRWCDGQGVLIPTIDERTAAEAAELARIEKKAEDTLRELNLEKQRTGEAEEKLRLLTEKLRAAGIDP